MPTILNSCASLVLKASLASRCLRSCLRLIEVEPKSNTLSHTMTIMSFSKLYLFAYNSLQAFAWAVAVLRLFSNFVSTWSLSGAYASAGELICFLQAASFLEVIHGALGIVPSGVLFPFLQWAGRSHFALAIVRQIVEVQELPSVFITFAAWGLGELIRYPYYALSCLGNCPPWISYLRYTAFIVLYPIGFAPGEMWLMYEALPFVKKKNLFADIFAALPCSYYNFLVAVFVCYPFAWSSLYRHMLNQRQSRLGGHNNKGKKEKIK